MDMFESNPNLIIGIAVGIFAGLGLAYLVVWSVKRQAKLVQQHIDKYNLSLSETATALLVSNKLVVIFDQSELIVSDISQAAPERISYSEIELVRTEWQKLTEKHLVTVKTKAGQDNSYRVLQAYHYGFTGQQPKKQKEAVIITEPVRERLESAGVAVEVVAS